MLPFSRGYAGISLILIGTTLSLSCQPRDFKMAMFDWYNREIPF